jgi:hypothetical protein
LLSRFTNPLLASLLINYLSLGIAVALLYLLAEHAGWPSLVSASVAFPLGLGFLRNLAIFAKPDILNYAIFLIGLLCLASEDVYMRILGACIWSILLPLKLIAVVFAPAAILVDYISASGVSIFSIYALHNHRNGMANGGGSARWVQRPYDRNVRATVQRGHRRYLYC